MALLPYLILDSPKSYHKGQDSNTIHARAFTYLAVVLWLYDTYNHEQNDSE